MRSIIIPVLLVVFAFQASSCNTTHQARQTETTSFLGDYTQLKPGQEGQALLIYLDPTVDLGTYHSIMIDPVRVYAGEDSHLDKISKEELQALVDYFDSSIHEQLREDYQFTEIPRIGTLRLRVALTEAKGSLRVLDTISSVMPPAVALSALKQLTTGVPSGVGMARVEMELLDAHTGQRVMAAVDERVGGKSFEGKFNKWDDVRQCVDYWVLRLKTRLAEERNRP